MSHSPAVMALPRPTKNRLTFDLTGPKGLLVWAVGTLLLVLSGLAALGGSWVPGPTASLLPAFTAPIEDLRLGEAFLDVDAEDSLDEDDKGFGEEEAWDRDDLVVSASVRGPDRASGASAAFDEHLTRGRTLASRLFRPPQA